MTVLLVDHAAPVTQRLTLSRLPCMGPVVRRWVRGLLETCPRVDDAELVAAELVSDALRYGRRDSITLILTIERCHVRLAMTDDGQPGDPSVIHLVGPWPGENHPLDPEDAAEDHARCLYLVGALAERWGHNYWQDDLSTLWAQLTW